MAEKDALRAAVFKAVEDFCAVDYGYSFDPKNPIVRLHEPTFSAGDGAAIHSALDELEAVHREVLVLHFLEDFSVAEIAGIVKCPEGTVKSRLFHARRAMRALLERGGYGPTR